MLGCSVVLFGVDTCKDGGLNVYMFLLPVGAVPFSLDGSVR